MSFANFLPALLICSSVKVAITWANGLLLNLVDLHVMIPLWNDLIRLNMCSPIRINRRPFAEVIVTLTEEQIKSAAKKLANDITDTSLTALFLQRIETSCKSIGYTAAAARANRQIMYAMCDRYGLPDIFFSLTPDDEGSFRVQLYAGTRVSYEMQSLH